MVIRDTQQAYTFITKRDRYWRRYWIEKIRQDSLNYSPCDYSLLYLKRLSKEDLLNEKLHSELSNIFYSKRNFSIIDFGIKNLKSQEIKPLGYNPINCISLELHEDHLIGIVDSQRSNTNIEIELDRADFYLESIVKDYFKAKDNSNNINRKTINQKVMPVIVKRDEDKSIDFISNNGRAIVLPQKDISYKYNNLSTKNPQPQNIKDIVREYKVINNPKSHQKEDIILPDIKASELPKSKSVTFPKPSITNVEIIKLPEVTSNPLPKSSGILMDKPVSTEVKIYNIKDLIHAIYADDFEKIEEILDGRKYLMEEYVAQSGNLEKEYKDTNLLAKNDRFYTWEKIEDAKSKNQKLLQKEWNIYNINEDNSGSVQLKFARIISTGKKKLLSAKYIVSQEDSYLSEENYEVSSLRYMKPIHLAALLGSKSAIYALMKNGADFKEVDSYGFMPIHYGIIEGSNSVVAILSAASDLEKELLDGKKYKQKISPLELAALLGKIDIFNCLILNQNEKVLFDLLSKAAQSDSVEMIRTIVENKEFIKRYSKKYPQKILESTIKFGDSNLLGDVLKIYNFKIDIFESKNLSNVLLEAAKSSQIFEIAKLLQSRFGDGVISALLRASDSHGNTPMHIIACKNPDIFSNFNEVFGSLGMCNIKMSKTWWQKLLFKSAKLKLSEIVNDEGNSASELFAACKESFYPSNLLEDMIVNENFVLGNSVPYEETIT